MQYRLENDFLCAILDDKAQLLSLLNRRSDTDLVKAHGLWRMIIADNGNLEVELSSMDAAPEVKASATCIEYQYRLLRTSDGKEHPIDLSISGELAEDELRWSCRIANWGEAIELREWHFPIINLSEAAEAMTLHSPNAGGEVIEQIRPWARRASTLYTGMDNIYQRHSFRYPGSQACTSTWTFANEQEGLYLASYDSSFQDTLLCAEIEKRECLNFLFVKFPFLQAGGQWQAEGYVLAPINGGWQRAADKYRAWAESWTSQQQRPDSVTDSQGWQRIIAKSQYGEIFYRFDDLPQIYADGAKAGIDTLFLFGWHQGGHDNDYPNYTVCEKLGGKENFKKNIALFQQAGGKVILYSNGQLIDKNADFYQDLGHRISTKDLKGNEQQQFYAFSGRGVAQRLYGNRCFVLACPYCPEWFTELRKVADLAHELGCDGVFYDQLGAANAICCDPSHGHPVPFTQSTRARAKLVARLRSYINDKYPGMSFGIEHISDITAHYADYIHTVNGGSATSNPAWASNGQKPKVPRNMDWFRYIFPKTLISNREIRDDTDIERRVNRLVLTNLISDVEIYRCKKTIAETPHYQRYLAQANAFRERNARFLKNAIFRSTLLHHCDNDELDSAGYLASDGSIVVMATQSHLASSIARIDVPDATLVACDAIGEAIRNDDGTVRIDRHGLILLAYQKKTH
jgi:hypothetical protein